MSISHWVPTAPVQTRRRVLAKALCGALTDVSNHSAEPNCHACAEALDELHDRERAEQHEIDALVDIETDPALLVKAEHFNPLAGYTVRGEKRKNAR